MSAVDGGHFLSQTGRLRYLRLSRALSLDHDETALERRMLLRDAERIDGRAFHCPGDLR